MKNIYLTPVVLLTFIIISLSACKKDSDEDTFPPYLFQISFNHGGNGIAFLSDKSGEIITEKPWTSGSTVTFYLPQDFSSSYPNFTVTLFRTMDNSFTRIRSYYDIAPGTCWKHMSNSLQFQYGSSELAFQNTPIHNNFVLISEDYRRKSIIPLLPRISYPYYENSFDLILVLNIDDQQVKYKKIENALNNKSVDLSIMESSEEGTVNIETVSDELSYQLTGISYKNPCYTDRYLLLDEEGISPSIDKLKIKYPPNMFEIFKTRIKEEVSLNSWNQYTYGDIPHKLERINADIQLVKTMPTDCELSTQGTYDYWGTVWIFEDENDHLFYWYVEGPKGQTKYSLPKIPESVKQEYSNLSRELFTHYSSLVCDYEGFTSFHELNHKYYELNDCYFSDPPNFRNKYVYSVTKRNKKINIDEYYSRK